MQASPSWFVQVFLFAYTTTHPEISFHLEYYSLRTKSYIFGSNEDLVEQIFFTTVVSIKI